MNFRKGDNVKNKYALFNDDEIYMLKRQAMESSYNIVMTGRYNEDEIKIHTMLLNELSDEDKKRQKLDLERG